MEIEASNWKRRFAIITAGQAFSLVGSSAAQFAIIWWLTESTGSALTLSIAGVAAMLPQLLLGPFAGVFVDRLKRKWVLMGADLFIAFFASLFAICFLMGNPPVWMAFAVLFLRGLGTVFHTPAIQATIPLMVPEKSLMRANAVSQFLQSSSFMLGPVLGAALYAVSLPLALLMDVVGATLAVISVGVLPIPDPPREKRARPDLKAEIKEGLAALWKAKRLRKVTLAATVAMLFFLPVSSLYPLMTEAHFHGNAYMASIVELAYAVGMMMASLLMGALAPRIKNRYHAINFTLGLMGVCLFAAGLLPASEGFAWPYWMFVGGCGLVGGAGAAYNIPYMAEIQAGIPPERQGRVFGLIGSLMSAAMPLGLLVAGPVAEQMGVDFWFLVSGAATLLIACISAWITRE